MQEGYERENARRVLVGRIAGEVEITQVKATHAPDEHPVWGRERGGMRAAPRCAALRFGRGKKGAATGCEARRRGAPRLAPSKPIRFPERSRAVIGNPAPSTRDSSHAPTASTWGDRKA